MKVSIAGWIYLIATLCYSEKPSALGQLTFFLKKWRKITIKQMRIEKEKKCISLDISFYDFNYSPKERDEENYTNPAQISVDFNSTCIV